MGAELLISFEKWCKEQGKSENTVKTYTGVLDKFKEWLEGHNKSVSEISKQDVQVYMNYLDEKQNRSASTIDKIFAAIRVFAQFLGQPDIVQNISKKEKEKNIYQTIPGSLSEKDKLELLKQVEKDKNSRNTAIIYTLLYTGIRISELCDLKISDIEIRGQKGILAVRNSQTEHERVIPLPKEVITHLNQYISTLEINEKNLLFSSNGNKPLSTRTVQYMLQNYNINPNLLRHTFCQDLVNKGMDISVVAQLAGHSDLNMTKRYKKKAQESDIVAG